MLFALVVMLFFASAADLTAITIDGQDYQEITIKRGDTRMGLAREYTGKAANWSKIRIWSAKVGRPLERVDDRRLRVGDVALIPIGLARISTPAVVTGGFDSGVKVTPEICAGQKGQAVATSAITGRNYLVHRLTSRPYEPAPAPRAPASSPSAISFNAYLFVAHFLMMFVAFLPVCDYSYYRWQTRRPQVRARTAPQWRLMTPSPSSQ